MKKTISIILTMTLVLTLFAGCGNHSSDTEKTTEPSESTESADTDDTAETESSEDHSDWVQMDLTYATIFPESHPSQEQINLFLKKAEERMDGFINITTYSSGSMISQTDMYNGIKNDVCDMGFLCTSTTTGVLDMCLLCDQPGFYYASGEASAMAMYDYYNWVAENTDELSEIVPLTVLGLAPQAVQCKKEITSIDDLKGWVVYGTPVTAEAFSRWGMSVATLDMSEIYEAARNGLIDSTIMTVGAAAALMLDEIYDYCYISHLIGSANAIVINRDVFERMPESQQKVFMELWQEVQAEFVCKYLEDFTYGNDTMSQNYCANVKYLEELPEDMEKKMTGLIQDLPEEYAAELDAKGLPGSEALAYYKEVVEKYNEMYPGSTEGYYSWREK